MILKQSPEDFVVEEIPILPPKLEQGPFCICTLRKTNKNTLDVIQDIAEKLSISQKFIGFAGLKDKHASTTQYISIQSSRKHIEQVHLHNASIEFLFYANHPISLGDLEANKFRIIARALATPLQEIQQFPNYFGEQRFGQHNASIGKAILQKEFKQACDLIEQQQTTAQFLDYRRRLSTDYIGALRTLSKKLLMVYISAYQSYIFNKTLSEYIPRESTITIADQVLNIAEHIPVQRVPLPGFATKHEETEEQLAQDNLKTKDFVTRNIPELSAEGYIRSTIVTPEDLSITTIDQTTQQVEVTLPRSAYATVLLQCMQTSS